MASAPQFVSVPNVGAAAVSTANTNRDGTGTIVDIWTAGSSGGKINRIVAKGTGDPADSVLTLFVHDGTSYKLFDEVDLGDPAAGSTTGTAYRAERAYDDLVLEAGQKLAAAITVALTSGAINVFAFGGDF